MENRAALANAIPKNVSGAASIVSYSKETLERLLALEQKLVERLSLVTKQIPIDSTVGGVRTAGGLAPLFEAIDGDLASMNHAIARIETLLTAVDL